MKFDATAAAAEKIKTDMLVLPLFADEKSLPAEAKKIDAATSGAVKKITAGKDFAAEIGETFTVVAPAGLAAKRLVLAGLGKRDKFDSDALRSAASVAARAAKKYELRDITFVAPAVKGLAPEILGKALAEGAVIGTYAYDKHKTDKKKSPALGTIRVVASAAKAVKSGGAEGLVTGRCVNMARELVTDPANECTPAYLAAVAKKIATKYRMKCRVLGKTEMEKLGMGALLSVAKGSATPAKFIVLEHSPKGAKETAVVVGKGLTFDSGGICLKPGGPGIMGMKSDMGGGAATLAIMEGVGALKLKRRVIGLVPTTENMPGGNATRPGDVVTSLSGKTVEVLNTDAEGRMILADALTYAERYKPDAVFDMATLTGSCAAALAHLATGIFGNNDRLIDIVKDAQADTGERVWQLPLWDEHRDAMRSEIADLRNISDNFGAGASTAAGFLSFFAEKYPWVHMDIAGTSGVPKFYRGIAKGPTGAPVRLVLNILKHKPLK